MLILSKGKHFYNYFFPITSLPSINLRNAPSGAGNLTQQILFFILLSPFAFCCNICLISAKSYKIRNNIFKSFLTVTSI